MSRFVYTQAVGDHDAVRQAMALGRSLKLIGDPERRVVATDALDHPWGDCFHDVLLAGSEGHRELATGEALLLTPDQIAFRRLAPLFEMLPAQPRLGSDGRFIASGDDAIAPPTLSVERNECRVLLRRGEVVTLVQPILYRRAKDRPDPAYEGAVRDLERLAAWERDHGFGYFPPGRKLRRSIEKRILRARGVL